MGKGTAMRKARVLSLGVCVVVLVSLMQGCNPVPSSSIRTYGNSGIVPNESVLSKIKPGETTKAWVLATLGDPAATYSSQDATENMKYEYVENLHNKISLLGLLTAKEDVKVRHTLCFELKDDVVTKFWKNSTELEKKSQFH